MATNLEIARDNMKALADNPYPGRGIVMGTSDKGEFVQVYWVMGRSANSRNRKLVLDRRDVWTEALDPSKVEDPSLIIYRAMTQINYYHIVSNGDQTDTVFNYISRGGEDLGLSLCDTKHEPDAPNYTPRITGLLHNMRGTIEFSKIIRRPDIEKDETGYYSARFYYGYRTMKPGFGMCLHTYNGDGNPLPSFDRDPYLVRLEGNGADIAKTIKGTLNKDNFLAVAVKIIKPWPSDNSEVTIINAAA